MGHKQDSFPFPKSLSTTHLKRKLPLKTTYLNIQDATDGWNAIRVRGAPAIAIVAALSLAVEVSNLKDFTGTSDDAASFISIKLEYLVSSRPTAVNLADAATKLKRSCIEGCCSFYRKRGCFPGTIKHYLHEILLQGKYAQSDYLLLTLKLRHLCLRMMLLQTKQLGHGASFIQRHLENSERFSVLTYCNTRSLATAGYGTALGVIRALHAKGVLERAYCTETRSFNQGSRLTAFELVHENIPATLIADSAAAALMKDGRVGAVIVGADRVASNGDTANKIGKYSLALCADYHKIPFYGAAPLTSIDLSLSFGEEIIIEERSPKLQKVDNQKVGGGNHLQVWVRVYPEPTTLRQSNTSLETTLPPLTCRNLTRMILMQEDYVQESGGHDLDYVPSRQRIGTDEQIGLESSAVFTSYQGKGN
ncbi:hypothetical protein SLEP1_g34298 [Rubroshorea leprosula]|uniref:S-methyl-5-thioribose-1-phosphate isomerase n=1 Tax=Rubroshorea leprosula TaxID=152421 RepID=A0AAV5KJC4_9ROSI|nr:hypothetical protein SLEP1_g34298 [Rubroshorea leprosula]